MMNPEVEFPKVDAMLHKLAWKAHRVSGMAYEDLRGEACLMFLQCCKTFKRKKKMKFSSWVYQKVWFHLQCVTRDRDRNLVFVESITDDMFPPADPNSIFRSSVMEQVQNLSGEAQEFVRTLLASPATSEITPKKILKSTCKEMGFEKGWDEIQTRIVLHEIQNEVKWDK